ncbi:nucleoside deaminase [Mesorhizobium sp. BR1-1-16]|uniref:nucleoside deaminase n=1 Tax=Mesorhizobium sp. BR1-1-16 TaxID=2876653 RepID=UPI001CCF87EA|nr:nucleoside deaminase [Mesorhizobium sp. BR1-1-16]MBZ9939416.1 nucleoside deaminase [Mesorhizobium sp. BR1-1-16]
MSGQDGFIDAAMQRAIQLSAHAAAIGNEPFGAVVLIGDEIVGEGYNQARQLLDPTAHGEVQAIRDACRKLGRLELDGCVLYTSCEPCALCIAAMAGVGIRKLYYAATLQACEQLFAGAPALGRAATDVATLRAAAGAPGGGEVIASAQRSNTEALAVVADWVRKKTAMESMREASITRSDNNQGGDA